jgi:hypothetical protein
MPQEHTDDTPRLRPGHAPRPHLADAIQYWIADDPLGRPRLFVRHKDGRVESLNLPTDKSGGFRTARRRASRGPFQARRKDV